VIDLAEELKIPLIYNSTSSLYGNQEKPVLLDEHAPLPEPTDNYCKYKLQTEEYIKNKKETNPEFKVLVLRPATVWGVSPKMRLDLLPNHFIYCAMSKGVIKISEPKSFRAEIDIDDIIAAYFKIIEKSDWPKKFIYNIGHHNLSKIEVAKIIQSVITCKVATINDFGDSRNLQINSELFFKDFGFKPMYSFEDTVIKMREWLEKNLIEIEKSNYTGVINASLDRWLKMI
jgi:nucleoside-diphosphate-sugar epimerase